MEIENLFGIKFFGLSPINLKPMVTAFTIVFNLSSPDSFLDDIKIVTIGTFVSFFMRVIVLFT